MALCRCGVVRFGGGVGALHTHRKVTSIIRPPTRNRCSPSPLGQPPQTFATPGPPKSAVSGMIPSRRLGVSPAGLPPCLAAAGPFGRLVSGASRPAPGHLPDKCEGRRGTADAARPGAPQRRIAHSPQRLGCCLREHNGATRRRLPSSRVGTTRFNKRSALPRRP